MKKIFSMLLLCVLVSFVTSCLFDPNNNIYDPKSDNYQGYPTYTNPQKIHPVKIPTRISFGEMPAVMYCSEIIGVPEYNLTIFEYEGFDAEGYETWISVYGQNQASFIFDTSMLSDLPQNEYMYTASVLHDGQYITSDTYFFTIE